MRVVGRVALVASLLFVASCAASIGLTIDLRTDYVPGTQFATVTTEVSASPFVSTGPSGTVVTTPARAEASYVDGVRVAEVTPVARGIEYVRVTLLDAGGAVVARRVTEIAITGTFALTVVVSRSCDGIVCPAPGGDAALTACNAGVCVDPRCASGSPELCGMPQCTSDASCTGSGECGRGRCASGVCLVEASTALCLDGRVCAADFRCVAAPSDAGGPDAGTHDAGAPDAGVCGARDTPCCMSRSCAAGTYCTDTSTEPMCLCGGRNEVCCIGRACDTGTFCTDSMFGPLCLCGARNQVCCPGRVCDDGSLCRDTMFGPICLCGTRNEVCCAGRVCEDGSICEDTIYGPLCLCGTAGHLCCHGTDCDDGTSCVGTMFGPICM